MKTILMPQTHVETISLYSDAAAVKQHTLTMQNMAEAISYSEECILRTRRDLAVLVDDINRITSLVERISSLHDELERIPAPTVHTKEETLMVFAQEDWLTEAAQHIKSLTGRLVG